MKASKWLEGEHKWVRNMHYKMKLRHYNQNSYFYYWNVICPCLLFLCSNDAVSVLHCSYVTRRSFSSRKSFTLFKFINDKALSGMSEKECLLLFLLSDLSVTNLGFFFKLILRKFAKHKFNFLTLLVSLASLCFACAVVLSCNVLFYFVFSVEEPCPRRYLTLCRGTRVCSG